MRSLGNREAWGRREGRGGRRCRAPACERRVPDRGVDRRALLDPGGAAPRCVECRSARRGGLGVDGPGLMLTLHAAGSFATCYRANLVRQTCAWTHADATCRRLLCDVLPREACQADLCVDTSIILGRRASERRDRRCKEDRADASRIQV